MEKIPYKTDGERDTLIAGQPEGKHIIHHINVDGSKELHILDKAPELSFEERLAALEKRMEAL